MRFSASPSQRSEKGVTINCVTYEGVAEFIYLSTLISNDNSVEKETQKRILAGNRRSVPHNRLVCCHDIDHVINDEDIET
jgi:superfamily II helicase